MNDINLHELDRKVQRAKHEQEITATKLATKRHKTICVLTVIGIIVAITGVIIAYISMQ